MLFNLKSSRFFHDPAMAGVISNPQHETHGLVFCLDSESLRKLNRWEGAYIKKLVSIKTYDGKVIDNVMVYTMPNVRLKS